jgi:hypothetical protein
LRMWKVSGEGSRQSAQRKWKGRRVVLGPGPMHRKNGEIDWPLWQCCWPARSDHRPGRAGHKKNTCRIFPWAAPDPTTVRLRFCSVGPSGYHPTEQQRVCYVSIMGIFQAGQTAHDQSLCPTATSIIRPKIVSYTIIIYKISKFHMDHRKHKVIIHLSSIIVSFFF